MKRTILINQEVLYQIDNRLDFIDAAIFHYMIDFSHTAKKTNDLGHVWFWVSGKKVIEDNPMTGINSIRGISKRIDKLVNAGLLIRYPDNESMRQSFFRVGKNYDFLNSSSSQRRTEILGNLEQKFGATPNESSTYSSIIDNSISDNYLSEFEKNSQSDPEYFEEIHLIEEVEEKKKVPQKKKSIGLFDEATLYPSFEDFWELYDKKTGREKAEKKWQKLNQREKEKIMEVLPDYKLSQPDKQYRKNPETYLNGKHWEDELIFKGKKMDAVDQLLAENGLTLNDLDKFRL